MGQLLVLGGISLTRILSAAYLLIPLALVYLYIDGLYLLRFYIICLLFTFRWYGGFEIWEIVSQTSPRNTSVRPSPNPKCKYLATQLEGCFE